MTSVNDLVSGLDNDRFVKLVNADIRDDASADEHKALRSAEVLPRWLTTLISLKRSCETQLADDRALRSEKRVACLDRDDGKLTWARFLAERDRWKAGSIRFKNGVEDKIAEARLLQKSSTNTRLRDAIIKHRDTIDIEDDADEILWGEVE